MPTLRNKKTGRTVTLTRKPKKKVRRKTKVRAKGNPRNMA